MSIKTQLLDDSEKEKINQRVEREAEKVKAEVEMLVAVVKQLNESLDDLRLDTKKGLMEALDELRAYHKYLDKHAVIYIQGSLDSKGEMTVWFEV